MTESGVSERESGTGCAHENGNLNVDLLLPSGCQFRSVPYVLARFCRIVRRTFSVWAERRGKYQAGGNIKPEEISSRRKYRAVEGCYTHVYYKSSSSIRGNVRRALLKHISLQISPAVCMAPW